MLSCWSKDSLERPSFSDIVCQLEKFFQFPNIVQEVGFTCYCGIKHKQIVFELQYSFVIGVVTHIKTEVEIIFLQAPYQNFP